MFCRILEKFTRRTKPIRIIGDPDNQLPDEWSSIVTVIINRNLGRFYFVITLALNFTFVHPLDTFLRLVPSVEVALDSKQSLL